MKATLRILLAATSMLLIVACLHGAPQQSAGSLSEDDLVKLIKRGASATAIVDLVQRYGVSFKPGEASLQRLKDEGAADEVLDALRKLAPPAGTKTAEATAREDAAKSLEAARHLKLGQLKAQDKDFDGALREFEEAEKIRPQWGEVFYQRGLVLAGLHRYSEAAADWKKYLNAARAEADVKTVQDKIVEWEYQAEKSERIRRLLEEGKQHLKEFAPDAAITAFQEVVKVQPSLENLLYLAQGYWMKEDYEGLSKTASQALALDQTSPQALLYQGWAELGQGATDRALGTGQRALLLDPKLSYGYELLCESYRQKRDFKNAQAQCEQALRINPNSGFAHDRMGWIIWNRGGYPKDYPGALEHYKKATQAEPGNADWQADLAYALATRKDLPGAIAAANAAVRLNPKKASAHDALGTVLEAQGNLDEAIKEYNEAVRLAPLGHPEFLDHLNKAMRRKSLGIR